MAVWYVFYRHPFESPQAMKFSCTTKERAEERAARELSNWGDKWEILYTLPASEVCPSCWHPWYRHENGECSFKNNRVIDGVFETGHRCPCRRKKPARRE